MEKKRMSQLSPTQVYALLVLASVFISCTVCLVLTADFWDSLLAKIQRQQKRIEVLEESLKSPPRDRGGTLHNYGEGPPGFGSAG